MEIHQVSSAPDVMSDFQVVADCLAAGHVVPSEVARRVRELADDARGQLLASHGVQDIGVKIIRQIRGELPQP